jgi:hypothetical protein
VRAETEVHADAEREVIVGVRAADVEAERIAEDRVVTIADRYDARSLSPFSSATPPTTASSCAWRMKWRTGVTHRIISFTAFGMRDGSSLSARRCAGSRMSASRPPASVLDVVSWPAVAIIE